MSRSGRGRCLTRLPVARRPARAARRWPTYERPRRRHGGGGAVHGARASGSTGRTSAAGSTGCVRPGRRRRSSAPPSCRCAAALQRWLGDVIEVDDVDVELDEATVRGARSRYRAARRTGRRRRGRGTLRAERRDRDRPDAAGRRAPTTSAGTTSPTPASTLNGIDWVEVDPADQRILHVGFLHPLPGQTGGVPGRAGARRRQRGHRGRRTDPRHRRRSVSPPPTPCSRSPSTAPATSRRTPCGSCAAGGRPRRPAGLRPRAVGAPVLVQGQLPERPRLRPPALGAPAHRRRADRRLPGQGLRRLPPADARPARPARARLDRAQPGRPAGHRGRGARPRRRPAVVPAGRRRPPRRTSAPPAAASRCAATPGCSTTACTTAAPPAPGCSVAVDRQARRPRPSGLDARHPGAGRPGPSTPTVTADRRWPRCSPAVRGVHAARPLAAPGRPQRDRDPHVGRRGVPPAGRRDPGHPRQRRRRSGWRPATCCCSRRSAAPQTGRADRRRPGAPPGRAARRRSSRGRPGGGRPASCSRSTWGVADALPFALAVTASVAGDGIGSTATCAPSPAATSCLAHHADRRHRRHDLPSADRPRWRPVRQRGARSPRPQPLPTGARRRPGCSRQDPRAVHAARG